MKRNSGQEVVLGLIQMKCVAEPEKNLENALEMIEEASKKGAQIICLQELFRSQYFCQTNNKEHFKLAEPIPGPTTEELCKKAAELQVVLVGSIFEKDRHQYHNTSIVINADGRLLGKYRKVHIPDDPQNYYSEKFYFTPGDLGGPVFETHYAKIGTLVCWDQWYPEPVRELAFKGAQIIFYPTSIGWPRNERGAEIGKTEYDAWCTVQRGHAIANTVFVAACNRTGTEGHLQFWGGSFVSDPFGKILAQASNDNEEILIVPCELNRINEVRNDWPFLTCRQSIL